MKYLPVIFAFCLISDLLSSQETERKVLMQIAGDTITAEEFIRMYRKGSDTFNLKDFENYLDQFIVFKLKVADAVSRGYDTTKSFRNELSGYRNQISLNYLTDREVKEQIIRKAYERLLKEIDAWHILVACPPDKSSEDTLAAWNKTLEIKARIAGGEPFEKVARSVSDDPSVRLNGGHLGYFTAFQMITPFEDAAYNLKKGMISEPVRTPYGYHLIMVADIRPSKGRIKVAHIMRSVPPNSDPAVDRAAEDTIKKVHRQLLAGASFSEMARKYSDHRETAQKGGELNWFGAGEISTDFAEAAFSLKNDGDFTGPVRTIYGWHIIKRLETKPPPSWEEARSILESKLNESWLNAEAQKSFVNKLKKEYNFSLNNRAMNWFLSNTDTLIIKGLKKYDRKSIPAEPLCYYARHSVTSSEFAAFIERKSAPGIEEDPETYLRKMLDSYISDHILNYENSVLESKFPDFRLLMKEFHDGILLFDISQDKVWNKAAEDSAGLRQFYESRKDKYPGEQMLEGRICILERSGQHKKFYKEFMKNRKYPDTEKRMIKKISPGNDSLLKVYKGTFPVTDPRLPAGIKPEKGITKYYSGNFPAVVEISDVPERKPLPFEKVRDELIPLYQEWLEKEWIEQLRKSFTVRIDNDVLSEIKKLLSDV